MIDLKSMSIESLAEWSSTFSEKVKQYAGMLGLSDTDVKKAEDSSAAIGTLADATKQARETGSPEVQDQLSKYKDLILNGPGEHLAGAFPGVFSALTSGAAAGMMPRLMDFVNKVRGSAGMTPEMADSMGLDAEKIEMVKRGEVDKVSWLDNFMEKIKANKASLGIPDAQVNAVSEDHEAVRQIEEQTARVQTASPDHPRIQDLLDYKQLLQQGPGEALTKALPALAPMAMSMVPGILPKLTGLFQKITHSSNFSPAIGRALGMEAPEMAGAGARAPERPGGLPTWLLPLIVIGLVGLLTWAFWPKGHKGTPANVGAGPLTISNLNVRPGTKEAVVDWVTDRPATGQIEYGKTSSLEAGAAPRALSTEPKNLVTNHALRLMGLDPKTRYFFRAISRDKDGHQAVSRVSSFQVP